MAGCHPRVVTDLVPVADRRTPLLLAVYGTLRRGCRNFALLADAGHVVDGAVAGTLHEVAAPRGARGYSYPLLVLDGEHDPAARVAVEVYRVKDQGTLAALDELEDYDPEDPAGSEYVRVVVPLLDAGPEASDQVQVQVYVHAGSAERRGPVLRGGDWYLHAGELA